MRNKPIRTEVLSIRLTDEELASFLGRSRAFSVGEFGPEDAPYFRSVVNSQSCCEEGHPTPRTAALCMATQQIERACYLWEHPQPGTVAALRAVS